MTSRASTTNALRSTDKEALAAASEADLRCRILPYWLATVDGLHGGYVLSDRHRTARSRLRVFGSRVKALGRRAFRGVRPPPAVKHVVSQSRLTWTFSLVHRLGYGDPGQDYLPAAEAGFRFLVDHMRDVRRGGFYEKAEIDGGIVDDRKTLYGQSFALYAMVEYHRATGSAEPLARARELFEIVQSRMHDDANSGWIEYCDADFAPLRAGPDHRVPGLLGRIGLKTGNSHVHWLEALSEMLEVTGDRSVRAALEEALERNSRYFFAADPLACREYLTPDWKPVPGDGFDQVSYGHKLEFAWLMIRAQEVLRLPLDWDHFDALLTDSLEHGFDHVRGGFFTSGPPGRPAVVTDKWSWAQAEGLAALSDALRQRDVPRYEAALDRLLDWIRDVQSLPDGIWLFNLREDGRVKDFTKASNWKAAYHEVRGILKFIKTFRNPRG